MSALAEIHHQKPSIVFKHVLIATDFSDASRGALSYALAIARRYGSVLSIAHAIPAEPHHQIPLEDLPRELNRRWLEAEEQMKRLGKNARIDDLIHHLRIEQGPVWDVLASAIRRQNVDLLVLGTHGRGGLTKLALGSVAEAALRSASCPVLTVGPHVPPAGAGPLEFNRILFTTDFGLAADKAFPYALFLAEGHRAKLVLSHMMPLLQSSDLGPAAYGPSAYAAEEYTAWQRTMRDESRRKLFEMLPPNAKLAVEPEYFAGMDFLPEGILELASAQEIGLIVMGANRTSSPRLAAHIPWALTHEVICHAKCPVLTCTA